VHNSKAQITIFLIFGIIIIIVSSLAYYSFSIKTKTTESEADKIADTSLIFPIQQYVESCMNTVVSKGIYFISSRGGYFSLPNSFFNDLPPTAFYIYNNKELLPTKEMIAAELSNYIDNQIEYCLDFSDLYGYNIKAGSPKSTCILGEDNIFLNMELPLTVTAGDTISKLSNFHISTNDDRLIKSLIVANNITYQIINNPDSLCFTCLFNAANEYDFDLNIDSYEESTYLFQLIDRSDEKSYDREYIFNFAVSIDDPE